MENKEKTETAERKHSSNPAEGRNKARDRKLYPYLIPAAVPIVLSALLIWRYTVINPETCSDNESGISTVIKAPGEVVIRQQSRNSLVSTETEISCSVIEDGLKDMGFLVTETYYFTEVMDITKDMKLFSLTLPLGSSRCLVQYDGNINAGVDFSKISVSKDEDSKKIIIHMPESEIYDANLDFDSFRQIDEKENVLNPISMTDTNNGQKELIEKARDSAVKRGILENAEENAQIMIKGFVSGVTGTEGYSIEFD